MSRKEKLFLKSGGTLASRMGRLQYDHERGVIYFFEEGTGECLLRIEGVRNVPAGHQIDIHLAEPGCAHHHEMCGAMLTKEGIRKVMDPGVFCAEKIEKEVPLARLPKIR